MHILYLTTAAIALLFLLIGANALSAEPPLVVRVLSPAAEVGRGDAVCFEAHTTIACMGVGWTFTDASGASSGGFSPQRNAGQRFRYRRTAAAPGRLAARFELQDEGGKPWRDSVGEPIPSETVSVEVLDKPTTAAVSTPEPLPAFSADRGLPDVPVEVRGSATNHPLLMTGQVVKNRMFFRRGERIEMQFRPLVPCAKLLVRRQGDDCFCDDAVLDAPADRAAAVYTTSMDCPGGIWVTATPAGADGQPVKGPDGLPVALTLGCLVDPDGIAGYEAGRPADFETFWAVRKERLLQAVQPAEMTPVVPAGAGSTTGRFHVSIPCGEAMPSTGGYARPVDAPSNSCEAVIRFAGYNPTYNAEAPVLRKGDRKIVFDFNTHGTPCGMPQSFYQQYVETNRLWQYGFESERNADPDSTYFKGMMMRMLAAIAFIKAQPEWDGHTLRLEGDSQGGFFALMGAALDPDVTDVEAKQPWLCDLDSEPAGRMGGWHPRWTPALAYYHPYYHMKRVKARVHLTAGLADTTCTASGILAVYQALPSPKTIDLHQAQGHCGAISAPGISVRLSNAGDGNDAAPDTPRPGSPRP